ncbi:ArnT family glycosyltransferase [Anaerostipes butyraticus]|uniref:Glycosyltransferase RgtA/B/C/D-like domain-containing protein n=1 Tax=Anaerostipes butyraticus TaxID=645466 RepID=A0A916Q8F9_9FIRM|nr:hypothetical protein [Anaerostipes butyraticus]GFO86254.1 hypothetical protein ANBU17_26010 [Anaerostipes butyraticus]
MKDGLRLKICNSFYRILLMILMVLMGICIWQGLFYIGGVPSIEKYNPSILILGIIVLVSGFIAVAQVIKSCSEKALRIISVVLLALILVNLIIFGIYLKYVPPYDLINVHAEAVDMLETGKISNIVYYAGYPNQQPLTILLYFVFSIAKYFGITNYNDVGIIFNILMIFLSAWFTYRICCLWSLKAGIISLIAFIVDPMLFSWSSHYYSDTLCMPFMLGGILLFLYAERTESKRKRDLFLVLAAFVIFIGGKIRMTAVFPLIAICIFLFIKNTMHLFFKKISFIAIGLICAIILSNSITNIYGVRDRRYEYPITHWIKLGLSENGMYTAEDNNNTKAQNTYEKKVNENISTIKKRVKEKGILGLEKLFMKKISKSWSSAAYTESLQTTVESYNTLYKYTIGRSAKAFNYWLQIVRCTMLIFAFLAGIITLKRKENINAWMFITILGGIIFYLFWEVKPKYSLCFLPIFYIIESYAITKLTEFKKINCIKIQTVDQKETCFNSQSLQLWMKRLSILVIAFTMIVGTLSYFQYVSEKSKQKDLRVKQTIAYGEGKIEEIGYEGVAQSFMAEGDFNTIEINFVNPKKLKEQEYILSILNTKGDVIHKEKFSSDSIQDNKMHAFHLGDIRVNKEKLLLTIRPYRQYEEYIGVNTATYPLYQDYKEPPDYYLNGCLYVGNKEEESNDLTFIVSDQHVDSIFSQRIFILLWSMVIIIEILISAFFYKTIGKREVSRIK